MSDLRFSGTDRYVATEDLTTAVNAATDFLSYPVPVNS